MKKNHYQQIGMGVGILIVGILIGVFLKGGKDEHAGHQTTGQTEEATTWTCSMHPQIQQPKPGKCPICGMDLIPLEQKTETSARPRELTLSHQAKQLAKITTVSVERKFPETKIRMVGKVHADETRVKTVAAWFPARIDRLYIDYTGVRVKKGDHLAHVYSPDLLTAQTELLTALKFKSDEETIAAARDKLRLWGLSEEKIKEIEQSEKAVDRMDINTPTGGIVIHKHINQGDYVKTGASLFKIADLSKVWIQLNAYESDLSWLRYGQPVTFEAEAVPGKKLQGIISFISPVLDSKTRTIKVRVTAENPKDLLKPGMFVRAEVLSTLAGGGRVISPELEGKWICPMHPEIVKKDVGECDICGMALEKIENLGYTALRETKPPLVVPTSAVLKTGKRSLVYVEVPDREEPTYEGREIIVGARAGDVYIVEEGLMEGEKVVSEGNFKIDSALQILAKPSMMSPGKERGAEGEGRGRPKSMHHH